MANRSDPSEVICSGDGLKFGYKNLPISATIDTRRAGPGELTVFCNSLEIGQKNAFCELKDHEDGFFTLTIRAQEAGLHELFVQYDSVDVRGSPFTLRVSPASQVSVRGEGLEDGVIGKNRAEFYITTHDVGPGDLKIRVGGPRGAFRVHTRKEGRVVRCVYSPRYSGIYVVNVLWEGDPVPGSPFQVFWGKNEQELARFQSAQSKA